jgi:hypothetical protein
VSSFELKYNGVVYSQHEEGEAPKSQRGGCGGREAGAYGEKTCGEDRGTSPRGRVLKAALHENSAERQDRRQRAKIIKQKKRTGIPTMREM